MGGSGESLRERTELTPQSINSAKPFRSKALAYKELGWVNPMPLPAKAKEPPPTGYTGRFGLEVTKDVLDQWFSEDKTSKSNIAIHLGFAVTLPDGRVDPTSGNGYCVIGLDVDENDDNPKKPKRGGSQLAMLESKLGALPPTWTSSARDNGVAGIRFFLAPSELEWRGNCSEAGAPHIDIVSLQHKYAVVYPSIHPNGGQYLWFPPGVTPSGPSALDGFDWSSVKGIGNGSGYSDPAETGDICVVPNVADLAVLPNDWVDYLTRNRTVALTGDDVAIDMDSTLKELMQWASKEFVPRRGMCKMMREAVAKHVENIENNDDHHYPLQEAHWHLLRLGAEGHHGWSEAIGIAENAWRERILGEGRNVSKRSKEKAERELKRSREGALRKVKGEADQMAAAGYVFVSQIETCYEGSGSSSSGSDGPDGADGSDGSDSGGSGNGSDGSSDGGDGWIDRVEKDADNDPKSYDCNDTAQARHFLDTYGSSVRFLYDVGGKRGDGGRWLIFDGLTWHEDHHGTVFHLYQKGCIEPTLKRSYKLLELAEQEDKINKGSDKVKSLKAAANKCRKVYELYSNAGKCKNMFEMAGRTPGVSMSFGALNPDDRILAMPNGRVIRLERRGRDEAKNVASKGYSIEANRKTNYTTMQTRATFKSIGELRDTENGRQQIERWQETLRLILPDKELRRFVQRVFGHMLLGGNDEKRMIFLAGKPHTGKSTLLNAFRVIGDYSGTFNPAAIMEDMGSKPNPELIRQWHRRVITNSESGLARLDAGMVKKISGRDEMMCRALNSNNMIEGFVQFTAVIATNKVPNIIGADSAVRNRMLVLPIETVMRKELDDKSATTRIAEECQDAILLWLLDGYRQYVRLGLDENTWPAIVRKRTDEFNQELSDVSSFIADVCDEAPDDIWELINQHPNLSPPQLEKITPWCQMVSGSFYSAYKQWVGEGERAIKQRTFANELKGLGFEQKMGRFGNVRGRVFMGIKLDRKRLEEHTRITRVSMNQNH